MFCSACGTEIQPGLSYCNRCGKRAGEVSSFASRPRTPLAVAGNIAGVGFVSFIFVMLVLVLNGVLGSNLVGITFFYFLGLFSLCLIFLRQSRLESRSAPEVAIQESRPYIKPATTAQLPEPAERPASVTEHTTRTLDHLPLDRN